MTEPSRHLPIQAVLLVLVVSTLVACGPATVDRRPGLAAVVTTLNTEPSAPSHQPLGRPGDAPRPPAAPMGVAARPRPPEPTTPPVDPSDLAAFDPQLQRSVPAAGRRPAAPPGLVPTPRVEPAWSADGGPDPLRRPIAAAANRHGDIYVVDAGDERIRVFASDGRPIRAWGGPGSEDGQFRFAAVRCTHPGAADRCATELGGGVAVDGQGRVYVADWANHRIQAFDRDGRFFAGWGQAGPGPGEFVFPSAIAVDGQSRVYVTDNGNARVQRFDGVGRFLGQWEHPGASAGQPDQPGALAIDRQGRVYLADARQPCIWQVDGQGHPLAQWEIPFPPGAAASPVTGLAVDRQGQVLVSDTAGRVHQFSPGGRVTVLWDQDRLGQGHLLSATSLAADEADGLYLADRDTGRLHKFYLLRPVTS